MTRDQHAITTVLLVYLTGEWNQFHRRNMLAGLAEELPASTGVLVIDRPVTLDATLLKRPIRFMRGVWHSPRQSPRSNLHILRPRLPFHDRTVTWMPAGRLNARILGRQILATMKGVYPNARRFLHWLYHPVQTWIPDAVPAEGLIYECYDEYSLTPDGLLRSKTWAAEQELLAAADVTFVTSRALEQRRKDLARRILVLPNGISDSMLNEASAPASDRFEAVPRPRMVCLGNLHRGWDYDLLEKVCTARPEWHLVLIGEQGHRAVGDQLKRLARLRNVHMLGRRRYEDLPAILGAMDLGVAALKKSALSASFTHLKLFEYLACGLPVISTLSPEEERANEFVRIAAPDPADFIAGIGSILKDWSPAQSGRARELAREYTWKALARRIVLPALSPWLNR